MKRTAADARFSDMVRERAGWRCEYPGCGTYFPPGPARRGLHSAHCFSRGKPQTRLDPDNAASLCYGHHRYIDQHPHEREAFFRARLGDDVYDDLRLRSNHTKASR